MRISDWSSDVCSSDLFDLVREERLAQLRVAYDASRPDGPTVTLSRQGRQVVSANPTSQTGRMLLGQFFAGFLTGSGRGPPSFQEADDATRDPPLPTPFPPINLASLHDFRRGGDPPSAPHPHPG